MIWLVCLFVAAADLVRNYWKATLEREIKWGLYRVRDELRWTAIKQPQLLENADFWELDDSLTMWCRHLDRIGLWPLLAYARGTRKRVPLEVRPDEPLLHPFYIQSGMLLTKHLRQRHWFLGAIGMGWLNRGIDVERAAEVIVRQPPRSTRQPTLRQKLGAAA